MSRPTSPAQREQLLRLVGEGQSIRAASRAVGISRTTGRRIIAASPIPFTGGPQPTGALPQPNRNVDQTPPPPRHLEFRAGYHDRTFRSFAEPLSFDGFTVERARAAISLHRQGYFIESHVLGVAVMSFGPILAALEQLVAPMLALPRKIVGGVKALARVLAAELTAQIAPASGLLPSPYFPPSLWGSTAITKAMAGFAVWQHAYGEEDPEDGTRPVYTRLWPNWSVQRLPGRRMFQAITDAGAIDIVNGDGKFTLVADVDEPHLYGAIVALGEEAIDGKFTQRARASYIDKYGNPKWVGTMPDKVGVRSPEGEAFFDALDAIRGPDGFGALPFGSQFDVKGMASSQSTVFKDALESNLMLVAMILLGQDGTMSSGSGGVYSSPQFGSVKRDVVDRNVKSQVRAANQGHVYPWLQFNYAASIEAQKARGLWDDPVIDIPLPDPEADKRIKSYTERAASLVAQIKAEREEGFVVDQDRVDTLADKLDVEAPTLATVEAQVARLELASADVAKVITVDEARAAQGLPPIGDNRGTKTIGQLDADAKAAASAANAPPPEKPKPEPAPPAAPSPDPEHVAA